MANLMQTGATWLGAKLKAHAGRTVSIEQGTTTFEDITATLAQHDYEVLDEEGFLTTVQMCDWTFVAADLVANDEPFVFRPGAIITETIDGVDHQYEAVPVGKRPCVENQDAAGVLVRVHTKKVA